MSTSASGVLCSDWIWTGWTRCSAFLCTDWTWTGHSRDWLIWGSGVENCKGGTHCEVWCWTEDAGTDVIRFRILSSLASCLAKEHLSRSRIVCARRSSAVASFPWHTWSIQSHCKSVMHNKFSLHFTSDFKVSYCTVNNLKDFKENWIPFRVNINEFVVSLHLRSIHFYQTTLPEIAISFSYSVRESSLSVTLSFL